MSNILERICIEKRRHLERRGHLFSLAHREQQIQNAPPVRPFLDILLDHRKTNATTIIAEIKKSSPSYQGMAFCETFDPVFLARAYIQGGATCVSVVTDTPYFQGQDWHLTAVRHACDDIPILRKDFFLEPYQVIEARVLGADCILLILAALTEQQALLLIQTAQQYNLDIIAEIHDESDLERAMRLPVTLIGINNRNLKTLEVDLNVTERLAPLIPKDRVIISESGIKTPQDCKRLKDAGVSVFLIGQALVESLNPIATLKNLQNLEPETF